MLYFSYRDRVLKPEKSLHPIHDPIKKKHHQLKLYDNGRKCSGEHACIVLYIYDYALDFHKFYVELIPDGKDYTASVIVHNTIPDDRGRVSRGHSYISQKLRADQSFSDLLLALEPLLLAKTSPPGKVYGRLYTVEIGCKAIERDFYGLFNIGDSRARLITGMKIDRLYHFLYGPVKGREVRDICSTFLRAGMHMTGAGFYAEIVGFKKEESGLLLIESIFTSTKKKRCWCGYQRRALSR